MSQRPLSEPRTDLGMIEYPKARARLDCRSYIASQQESRSSDEKAKPEVNEQQHTSSVKQSLTKGKLQVVNSEPENRENQKSCSEPNLGTNQEITSVFENNLTMF